MLISQTDRLPAERRRQVTATSVWMPDVRAGGPATGISLIRVALSSEYHVASHHNGPAVAVMSWSYGPSDVLSLRCLRWRTEMCS